LTRYGNAPLQNREKCYHEICNLLAAALLLIALPAFGQGSSNAPINPADFGVVCDGATDDSIAIQNTVNASEGVPILFNAGTCLVTQTIYATPGLTGTV